MPPRNLLGTGGLKNPIFFGWCIERETDPKRDRAADPTSKADREQRREKARTDPLSCIAGEPNACYENGSTDVVIVLLILYIPVSVPYSPSVSS